MGAEISAPFSLRTMLTRYEILTDFCLDGDFYKCGSTFIYEYDEIAEILEKSGFLKAKPQTIRIDIITDPYNEIKYLSQMNKPQLIEVARNENIDYSERDTKRELITKIKATRARRGEKKR